MEYKERDQRHLLENLGPVKKKQRKGWAGFQRFRGFQSCFVGETTLEIANKERSLLARVFKSRYYAKSNPLTANVGSRPSYAWRSIHSVQGLMKQGTRVLIGNREDGYKGVARSLD